MSTSTVPPKEKFRFDMLWNDSRYRSSFMQVIALFAVLLGLLYIFDNVRDNLAALGKTFGFSFMGDPSSYDINQRPIEYTSRDSHARAAVIGMINTMLVALLGCILATIIGVLAGVARLSKNWLIRQLMTVYIEGVRNIPVLIQILLVVAVINETLPQPRDFRGEDATAGMLFSDSVAATNRGIYIPSPIMEDGSLWVIVAFILSIVAIVVFGRWRTSFQDRTGEEVPQALSVLIWPAGVMLGAIIGYFLFRIGTFNFIGGLDIVDTETGAAILAGVVGVGIMVLAGTSLSSSAAVVVLLFTLPTLVVFFAAGQPISLDFPALKGFNFKGGVHLRDSYVGLTLALSIYTGAFIAENVRAGIQAVSRGQTEAAYALGLQPGRTMSLVILPQALRIIIPPMISQYLNLTKNSSLALLVGYMDATGTLGGITLNQTGKEFETLFLLMAFYLTVSLSIAAVMNLYNQNAQLVERTSSAGGGFSLLGLFDRYTGDWEQLKRGDATMDPRYGIRGVLNLYVLFYAAVLLLLINYVFIEKAVLKPYLDAIGSFKTVADLTKAAAGDLAQALPRGLIESLAGGATEADVRAALKLYTEHAPDIARRLAAAGQDVKAGTISAETIAEFVKGLGPEVQNLSPAFYLRPNYFSWPGQMQFATVAMLVLAFGALITCIFKSARFFDLAVLELIVFIAAIATGWPFGQMIDGLGVWTIVIGGLCIRVLILGYTLAAPQANLTFFQRTRRA